MQSGYHRLYLEKYNTWVEQTTTDRVSFYRLTYTEDATAHILLNLGGYVATSTMVKKKYMSGLPFDPIIIAVVAVVVILIGILASGYVKAPADKAYIISGLKKVPKVLIGRAGIKIPFLERKDELLLKQIGIDIKTGGYVPTKDFIGVDIDAIAKIRLISMHSFTSNFFTM